MTTHSSSAGDDLLGRLAGLSPHGPVAALRAHRANATRHTQESLDTLLAAKLDDFPPPERLAAAAYAAALAHADDVAREYCARLAAADPGAPGTIAMLERLGRAGDDETARLLTHAPARLAAALVHVRAVTLAPAATALEGPQALAVLQRAGLSTRAIVVLSQLIAFVAYQVRVVAAFRALEEIA